MFSFSRSLLSIVLCGTVIAVNLAAVEEVLNKTSIHQVAIDVPAPDTAAVSGSEEENINSVTDGEGSRNSTTEFGSARVDETYCWSFATEEFQIDLYGVNKHAIIFKNFEERNLTSSPGPNKVEIHFSVRYNASGTLKHTWHLQSFEQFWKKPDLKEQRMVVAEDGVTRMEIDKVYFRINDEPRVEYQYNIEKCNAERDTLDVGALIETSHGVSSGVITLLDSNTLLVRDFTYAGDAPNVYFWVGNGEKPDERGTPVPNEAGSTDALVAYSSSSIVFHLPNRTGIYDATYFGVYCTAYSQSFGYIKLNTNEGLLPYYEFLPPNVKHNPKVDL